MDGIVHIMRRVANQWDMVIGKLFKKPFDKLFLSIHAHLREAQVLDYNQWQLDGGKFVFWADQKPRAILPLVRNWNYFALSLRLPTR